MNTKLSTRWEYPIDRANLARPDPSLRSRSLCSATAQRNPNGARRLRTCKGVYLLTRPTGDTDVELMVLSLFGAATASACHDGEALYRAAAFDRRLPFVFDKRVAVYEVSTGSRRALSYANLQRRFPLRLMAPR